MLTFLFLMVLVASSIAQDTIWVETSYQKNARQKCEQIQKGYEDQAESLKNARDIIRQAHTSRYRKTRLEQILDGINEANISITELDKTDYLLQLKDRMNHLKLLYEKNQQFLNLCELDRKSGEFYIVDKKLYDIRKNMTAEQVDALMLIKEGSPSGRYYEWGDWLFLTLSHRLPNKKL